jgi:carboxyvinyl-carboxyphosphonate phosphorylmutase
MVFDPISARIAEDLGFELALVTNPGIAASVLGAPERVADVVLTSSEMAQQVRRICRASSISLMVSTHQGYGNSLQVMRAVEELENGGVSGLSIDDTVQPLGFGSAEGQRSLISLEEAVGKLKAALAARQDPSLVIQGATRALETAGIAEAIRRIIAYEKVGVDAIHLSGGETEEGIAAVHAETKLPLLVHSRRGVGDERFLAANGVRVVAPPTGNLALFASVKAVYDTLKALRDGKSPDDLRPTLAPPELLARVTRQSQYNEWINSFQT